MYVSQAYILQGFDFGNDVFVPGKKLHGLIDAHFQDLVDVFAFVFDLQHFRFETFAVAHVAFQAHIGQELHFDDLFTFPFTSVATTAIHVERKMFGFEAPDFGQLLMFRDLRLVNVLERPRWMVVLKFSLFSS